MAAVITEGKIPRSCPRSQIPRELSQKRNTWSCPPSKISRETADKSTLSEMSETEKVIARALAESPETAESVMEKLGLEYGAAIEAIISLEMSGFLVRGNDGVYSVK